MSRIKAVAALIITVLLLTACAPGGQSPGTPGSQGGKPVVIGLTYIPNIQFAPFYAADDSGALTTGVSATLRHHGATEGLFTALLGGQEQFVLAGAAEMMQARSQGGDLIAIAGYYRAYPARVIVPENSSYRSAADLKGKKIGLPGRFGENWFALQAFLAGAGMTEHDVQIVEIGYTQQAALTTGKVDAVVGYANNDMVQFAQAGFAVRGIEIADEVPLVSVSLITTRKFATENPEATKAVVKAMTEGIKSVVADPDGAVTISAKHVPNLNQEQAKKSARATLGATNELLAPGGTVDVRLDQQRFVKMGEFMLANKIITTPVNGADAMTNDYVG